ncbi:MAG: D-alanine--D-alanine ligase A, partial [Oscillospiraceae bacterium]
GSSVGISKAKSRAELRMAVELAFDYDRKVIVEREIKGKEIECAVLGNTSPVASVVGEIVPSNEFYDYEAKYVSGTSSQFIPARVGENVQNDIRAIAIKSYRALGCAGLARVDFLYEDTTGEIYLNELNTIPGFTSISMYPKLFDASGIKYPELLKRLIELAISRNEGKND